MTSYEMCISDWSSDVALPICKISRYGNIQFYVGSIDDSLRHAKAGCPHRTPGKGIVTRNGAIDIKTKGLSTQRVEILRVARIGSIVLVIGIARGEEQLSVG